VLATSQPIFLLLDPIQGVITHLASRNIETSKQSNAEPFKPH
jgi:hypothetical protein